MIDVHYSTTPNGHKVTIFLEEAGLPYRVIPVAIGAGDQFKPDFLAIAPNNRILAIIDTDPAGGAPIGLFESGVILPYLAEKTGRFLSADIRARPAVERAYALAATINTAPVVSEQVRALLFGSTAALATGASA